MTTHRHKCGRKQTVEYSAWQSLIFKCENPQSSAWPWYGARGVRVDPVWRHDFMAFYRAVGPKPRGGRYRLERISKAGHFEPGNVAWMLRPRRRKARGRTERVREPHSTHTIIYIFRVPGGGRLFPSVAHSTARRRDSSPNNVKMGPKSATISTT
jgi:hypothetical protein